MFEIDATAGELERLLFDTTDVGAITEHFVAHFAAATGADPTELLLYRRGTGIVCGVVLTDQRRAVAKVHRRDLYPDGVEAISEVQTFAHARGLPAPSSLAAPRPLCNGIATTDEFVDQSFPADLRSPSLRQILAAELARFIATCRDLVPIPTGLSRALNVSGDSLWPTPHDLAFDFGRTAQGAEWIDEAGSAALAVLRAARLPLVIGHADWRPENLSIANDELRCIYDWDSLATASEAELVGSTAGSFLTIWQGEDPLPTLAESRGFVEDYELAVGHRFSADEWLVLEAALVYHAAYGSRCQHSREYLAGVDRHDHQWKRVLHEALATRLRDAT